VKARCFLWSILLFAVGALLGPACGAGQASTTEGLPCSTDDACGTGEVCPPAVGVCVRSCTGSAGCPDSRPNCAALNGSAAADGGLYPKVCQ
jgi:hypothetical protein